jgi:hypothetical protein
MPDFRTDEEKVKAIMVGTTLKSSQLTPFVEAANRAVTDHCSGKSYSDELLEQIECWLAAHLVSSTIEPAVAAEAKGSGKVTYHGKTGMGLDSTAYGQHVKILDTAGGLQDEGGSEATIDQVFDG